MSRSRPHELYRITTDYVRTSETVTKYVFGIDQVPAVRDAAIEDCDFEPAYVIVWEWSGKRWWAIDKVMVNGGLLEIDDESDLSDIY